MLLGSLFREDSDETADLSLGAIGLFCLIASGVMYYCSRLVKDEHHKGKRNLDRCYEALQRERNLHFLPSESLKEECISTTLEEIDEQVKKDVEEAVRGIEKAIQEDNKQSFFWRWLRGTR